MPTTMKINEYIIFLNQQHLSAKLIRIIQSA